MPARMRASPPAIAREMAAPLVRLLAGTSTKRLTGNVAPLRTRATIEARGIPSASKRARARTSARKAARAAIHPGDEVHV